MVFLIGVMGGVKLDLLDTAATYRSIVSAWVIMMMEKLVEWWLAGETEVLGENLSQCRSVHHKPHMTARMRTRTAAVGSQRWIAWATTRALCHA
jgi:hypothetical protein